MSVPNCFWWDACACYPKSSNQCNDCKYILKPNQNEIVNGFYEEKEKDVERAMEPVYDKWIARFELYKHLFINHEL